MTLFYHDPLLQRRQQRHILNNKINMCWQFWTHFNWQNNIDGKSMNNPPGSGEGTSREGRGEGTGEIFTTAEMHLTVIDLLNFYSRTSECFETCPNQKPD